MFILTLHVNPNAGPGDFLGAAMLAHYGSVPLLFVYGQIAVGSAFFGILIFIYGMIFAPLWGLTFGLIYRALTIGENT
jgi:hypothetical protein